MKTNELELMTLCSNTPAALPRESCEKAINWFEQNIGQAKAGGVGKRYLNNPSRRSEGRTGILSNLELPISIEGEDFFDLCTAIGKGLNDFKEKYRIVEENVGSYELDISDILMCKWEPNNHFEDIHCEVGEGRMLARVFSWMFYLNDIEQGGGTEFIYQDFTTIPRAGDMIIFPSGSSHMHRGENAPFEKKYTITGHFIYTSNL